MYLIDFSESNIKTHARRNSKSGYSVVQSHNRRNKIKRALKYLGAVAGTGLAGYGLYRGGKLSKKVYKNIREDYLNAKEIIKNTRQVSEQMKDLKVDEANRIIKNVESITNRANLIPFEDIATASQIGSSDIIKTRNLISGLNPIKKRNK